MSIDIRQSLRKKLTKDSLTVFVIGIISTGLSLVTSMLLARGMGAQGYGVYAYAFTILAVMQIVASLGLPNLLARRVSAYRARGQWDLLAGIMRRSVQAALISTASLTLVALLAGLMVTQEVSGQVLVTYLLALGILPFMVLTSLRSAVLRALMYSVSSQIPESVLKPTLFLAMVTTGYVLLARGNYLAPQIVMGMQLAATIAAFGLGLCLLRMKLPRELTGIAPRYEMTEWRQSAVALLVTSGITAINIYTDTLMLGALKGAEAVGIYQVVVRGSSLMTFFVYSVNMVMGPVVAGLYAGGEKARLQRMITASARMVLLITLPLAFILTVFPEVVLRLLFGGQFTAGATALMIMALAQLVSVSMGPTWDVLIMTGHEKDVARGVVVSALLNIVLNAILIPSYGILGAAISTSLNTVIFSIAYAVLVYYRTGLHVWVFGGARPALGYQ